MILLIYIKQHMPQHNQDPPASVPASFLSWLTQAPISGCLRSMPRSELCRNGLSAGQSNTHGSSIMTHGNAEGRVSGASVAPTPAGWCMYLLFLYWRSPSEASVPHLKET
jgi:hypothetical protein